MAPQSLLLDPPLIMMAISLLVCIDIITDIANNTENSAVSVIYTVN